MADFTSPLQAVNWKELELPHRVEEARRGAEGQIKSVREEAKQTIARALADSLDGTEVVRSAAFAAQSQLMLEVTRVNIMGVPRPFIERKSVARGSLDRGYSLPTVSSRIDAAAEVFETLLDLIIELADSEMRLRRLAA